jgi:hypothetical protein
MPLSKAKFLISVLPIAVLLAGLAGFLLLSLENRKAYETAIEFFKQNQELIKNKNYVAVIDYTKPSFVKRLFIYDVKSGTAARYLVAHGKGSGFIYARDFSNEANSNKSSKGFFITGEIFVGEHGPSLALHGLQEGLNDNAFSRDIIIHGADYVSWQSIIVNLGRLGRSLGCPAVAQDQIDEVISKLKGGALVYVHAY